MDLPFYNWSKVLLYARELERKDAVFIDLHPSDICNHSCVWCRYMRTPHQLSWAQLVAVLEKYRHLKGVAIGGGGEPLTNRNLPKFIQECGRRGIVTGIYTNGGLFNEESIHTVRNHCRFCRISLDAARKETHAFLHGCSQGDFGRILDNVRKLRKTPLELGLSYLVVPENVDEIPMLADLDLPIDYVHFKPLVQGIDEGTRAKGIENARKLQKKADFAVKFDRLSQDLMCNHSIPCEVQKIIRVVAANGKEYVCCEHDQEEEFEVGKWNGSTTNCRTCRYNPYNEIIHAYRTNSMAKELL